MKIVVHTSHKAEKY